MLSNNGARYTIWTQLSDPFNYEAFTSECIRHGLQPLSMQEFATKVGLMMCAKSSYPGVELKAAYLRYIEEANKTIYTAEHMDGKPCCGGGQVK